MSSSSSFPTSEERIVASALLLLHTPSPKFHSNEVHEERRSFSHNRFREISVTTDSDESSSAFSSLLINGGDESSDSDVSFFSATNRYHQMKFKIARKSRSKVVWTSSSCSGDRKVKSETTAKVSPTSFSGEATSCLSTTSSSRSLRYANRTSKCRSVIDAEIKRETPPAAKLRVKNPAGTPHLRRRGDAILRFLSHGGWSSEVKIREMLGDSPDTSKALRM
ncbi:uncharacterized protein [Medicago truncatula]|nr:uncharacterized protein LOC25480284 [Medicago truncatula]KEH16755.1 hypothetical protein MTR_0100s0190 [Medicago truncatula]